MGKFSVFDAGKVAPRALEQPFAAVDVIELIAGLARAAVQRAHASYDPRDLAQEVVLSLLEHDAELATPAHVATPAAYYTVIVRNRLSRELRRNADQVAANDNATNARSDGIDDSPNPEEIAVLRASGRQRLRELSRRLRPRDRRALALLLDLGLPAHQVAATLNTSVNHVHQMRHRIRAVANDLTARARVRGKRESG